ncbi:flagellar biosynthesis protein FlhG [Candidatus Kryptonium thompsonii]|uniref:Flagellar biosynthesis protein FlhG n=1 Tax=Candidatus Kryptonium thompsonii TaxID=1633631 RepID=A0A0N7MZQ0_9BACT|nr:MinD/ParA family protein [Candidatus Kryptonium thompsoni]CUS76498.1 flagellar biosynthesis protein FlhG [Candidatus Kryptonium thompsoni]CUS83073.1 flagellar biosynthesis protein FlhG [Candidatus Kryptonium thompsoni]CUS84063.1 flagellar biosynthesis protein FlhG [Candidatus Kryptonium thompsoni]CUS93596.1 flagellar biosynthesis protein FlhG [Candidatus Kryptonium thompsoni]CUS96366.1 flagellar biosynthesis protein FlhG [Candidatus Kryptonium thompsoni]
MIVDQAEKLRSIVSERINQRSRSAHVIAVGSGKGGCGKTNITLNLGLILSKNKKKVLIYDADLNLANMDILLGITPKFRFLDFIRGEVGIEDVLIEIRENLKLIPANSGVVNFPKISGERLIQVINEVLNFEEKFDFILIDTPAGISEEVIKLLGFSDDYILVVTPEPTSVMDAYAVIKIVYYQTGKANAKLIVNNVNGSVDPSDIANRLSLAAEKFLGVRVDYIGSVPTDFVVPKSVMMQKPFVEAFPRSAASIALNKIAMKLLSLNGVKKQNSFFGRLMEL